MLAAAASSFAPIGSSLRTASAARTPLVVAMGAKKGKSRYADDGTREKGIDIGLDKNLGSGLFSNFKWGTEVEVGDPTLKAKKKDKIRAGDSGVRGGGYTNTESKRFSSVDEGQMIRKAKLEAYIEGNGAEAADPTFGKYLAGTFLIVLISLLVAVINYYGIDGFIAIGNGRSG